MSKVVDVQFPKYGKVGVFDAGELDLSKGCHVLVETESGLSIGVTCSEPRDRGKECAEKTMAKVSRPASEHDLEIHRQNEKMEEDVYEFCSAKIQEKGLPMNLVSVDRLFESGKIIVYFTAEGRVDFRELVKDLVQRFRTRIEMRQIGVRHQAKMVGGLGSCGRQLCCVSFLANFDPVSIKMAKEQNLSLNPAKISGMCGRLMCCLSYEYKYYEKAKKGVPKVGKKVNTSEGEGKVLRQNALTRKITVLLASGEERELSYDDIIRNPVAGQTPPCAAKNDQGSGPCNGKCDKSSKEKE